MGGIRKSTKIVRKVGGFLRVLRFPPLKKNDRHDIAEILLKVALNTIKQTSKNSVLIVAKSQK